MPSTTFSIFLDEDLSSKVETHSMSTSSHKSRVSSDRSAPATKENVNPLTGLSFNSQPLKKRKPSSSSALKVKPLPSSSKMISKSKRLHSSNNHKDKGKKRVVLGSSESRNAADCTMGVDSNETEQSQTALGNRRAFEFTVMPLANVTQAYDESEATRAFSQASLPAVDEDPSSVNMVIDAVAEEVRIPMRELSQHLYIHFSILLNYVMRLPRKQYQLHLLSRLERKTHQLTGYIFFISLATHH